MCTCYHSPHILCFPASGSLFRCPAGIRAFLDPLYVDDHQPTPWLCSWLLCLSRPPHLLLDHPLSPHWLSGLQPRGLFLTHPALPSLAHPLGASPTAPLRPSLSPLGGQRTVMTNDLSAHQPLCLRMLVCSFMPGVSTSVCEVWLRLTILGDETQVTLLGSLPWCPRGVRATLPKHSIWGCPRSWLSFLGW